MKIVSVISPMYNVEQYATRFLDMLLKQTYPFLEIILVNDGSTDNTNKIIDYYSQKDHRIKVIHKPNGGISSARMAGMQKMTGYYCLQLDADDTFETNMIEHLVKEAEKTDADITFCDYDIIYTTHTQIITNQLDNLDKIHYLKAQLAHGMWSVYWNKLIKTSLFKEYNIYPIIGIQNWEDYVVTNRCALYANKIAYVKKVLYHYNRTNINSVTFKPSKKLYEDSIAALNLITKAIKGSNINKEVDTELKQIQLTTKHFLIFTQYRNFEKWRNTFSEANSVIQFTYKGLEKHIVYEISKHHDLKATLLLLLWRIKRHL